MRAVLTLAVLFAAPVAAETIYVSDEESSVIHVIDGKSLEVAARLPVGKRPRGMGLSKDGRLLYIAVSNDNRIDVLDLASRRVVGHLPSGPDPELFALHPSGAQLFVANEDDNLVSFVDVAGKRITREVTVGTEPEGMAVSPDGRWVINTSEASSMVHFIDAANGQVVDSIMVDTRPRFARFTPDGRQLWVTSEVRATLSVIDVATRKIVGVADFEAMKLPTEVLQPVGIEMTRDGRRAFVALGRGRLVAEIDPKTLKLLRTYDVGFRAWNLALSPDEARLYTANGLDGDMSVVDIIANRTVGSVKLGGKPWGIVVAP
jgi:PQQ-dependent catabolism-associated beta-propeller protein